MTRRETDAAGVSYAPDGPEDRFLKAFDEYNDALCVHASLRLSDRERAIEVVHDTYAKVWTYLRRGHQIDAFRPFLYKVLNNLIIDEYRRNKPTSLDALLEADGIDESHFAELQDDSVDTLLHQLDGAQALTIISELPEHYREVLIFRFVDELKPSEISDLIEESENTVSVRIHRGLKLLKRIIDERVELREEKRTRRSPHDTI